MREILNKFAGRFSEPSSWAGISVLLVILGVPPGVPEIVSQVGAGIAAGIAILLKEKTV